MAEWGRHACPAWRPHVYNQSTIVDPQPVCLQYYNGLEILEAGPGPDDRAAAGRTQSWSSSIRNSSSSTCSRLAAVSARGDRSSSMESPAGPPLSPAAFRASIIPP